jgi:hypothetical protein
MTPIALLYASVHKTLLKSLQEHCQMVFSRFLSMTIFIPAENTRHSQKPGQNPENPVPEVEGETWLLYM